MTLTTTRLTALAGAATLAAALLGGGAAFAQASGMVAS